MAAPVYVCFWYEIEDFLTPTADEAALRLARLHTQHGVPATFKVVGERARILRGRGRDDVIDALRQHAIGYHTDLHSVHPTVTEYCERLGWADGQALFRRTETRGFNDVVSVFHKGCGCFGQAGAAWAPHLYPVLREWGVRSYLDSGPWLHLDGRPFRYMGVLHVFGPRDLQARLDVARPEQALDAAAACRGAIKELGDNGGGVLSLGFQDWNWVTDEPWDHLNFARGHNPPAVPWYGRSSYPAEEIARQYQLELPRITRRDEVDRRFAALELFLRHFAGTAARPISAEDLPLLFPDNAREMWLSRDELLEVTADWTDSVSFVQTDRGWLTAAEVFTVVAGLLREGDITLPGSRQRAAQAMVLDGPTADRPALTAPVEVGWRELVSSAEAIVRFTIKRPGAPLYGRGPVGELSAGGGGTSTLGEPVEGIVEAGLPPQHPAQVASNPPIFSPAMPSGVRVGSHTVRPEEWLLAAVRALRTAASTGDPPEVVELTPARLEPARYVRHGPDAFDWPIFPRRFSAPDVLAHARRQAWTLKPAR